MLTVHRSTALPALALTLALFAAPAVAHGQFGRLMKRAAKAAAVKTATQKVEETAGVSSQRGPQVTDESVSKLIVQLSTQRSEMKRLMEQDPKYRQAQALRQAQDACGPQILKADQQQVALENQLYQLLGSSASEDEKMEKGSKLRLQMQEVPRPACEATTGQMAQSVGVGYTPPNMNAIRTQAYDAGLQRSGLSDADAAGLFEHLVAYFSNPGEEAKLPAADAHREELLPLLTQAPEFSFMNPEITSDVLGRVLSVTPRLRALPSEEEQEACTSDLKLPGVESAQAMMQHFQAEVEAAKAAGDFARMQAIADSAAKAMTGNEMSHVQFATNADGTETVGTVSRLEIAAAQQCGTPRDIAHRDLIVTAGLEPKQYDNIRKRLQDFASRASSPAFLAQTVNSDYTPAEFALLKAHAAEIIELFRS